MTDKKSALKSVIDRIVKKYKGKVSPDQLGKGINIEREHTGIRGKDTKVINDTPADEAKIALAHLKEVPNYYTKLAKYVETANEKE